MAKTGESVGDVAKAADKKARRRLGTNVHLLRVLVDQLVHVTEQLQQITTAIALAHEVEAEEGDPSTPLRSAQGDG